MNKETVWYENPIELGAIAGSGMFKIIYDTGNKFEVIGLTLSKYTNAHELLCWNYSGQVIHRDISKCTLLARNISSLTEEEVNKTTLKHRAVLSDYIRTNRLKAIDFFYLLSIGVWNGSDKNVEYL